MSIVFIEASFDNIYSFATCKLKLFSNSHFSIVLPSSTKIVGLEMGVVENPKSIHSLTDKGIDVIKLTVLGMMSEVQLLCADGKGTVESYGMQYFPFVSARIRLNLELHGAKVGAVTIALPDTYRVIWFKQYLHVISFKQYLNVNNRTLRRTLKMSHSHGEKESLYVFSYEGNESYSSHSKHIEVMEKIDSTIPVRLGGKEYLRIVTFPSIYSGISLFAVFLLALQDKPNLTLSAVAASYVLMLRHFNSANAPQLNTILRDIYLLFGLLLFVWAVAGELFEYKALFGLPILALVYFILRQINKRFTQDGVLPMFIEKFIYQTRRKNERKNSYKT